MSHLSVVVSVFETHVDLLRVTGVWDAMDEPDSSLLAGYRCNGVLVAGRRSDIYLAAQFIWYGVDG